MKCQEIQKNVTQFPSGHSDVLQIAFFFSNQQSKTKRHSMNNDLNQKKKQELLTEKLFDIVLDK